MKFGKSHDFVFVGKETIATASGIYVSFLDLNTRERRIERFDNKERSDGASCLAGHPTVSMFSVVERKPNPKISIFVYPTLQRISRCILPDKINGYLSCSFAGTEYLISLTSFPDFRLIVWLWKTGKHVAMLNTKIDNLVQEIYCSPNPPHLISQLGLEDNTFSIYQVRTCSKIVSIHRVNAPVPEHKVVSSSWTPEGNLFVSDEFGNVWLVAIEANKLYSVVKSKIQHPKNKPIVVTHKSGVIVVNTNSEIMFYKKTLADWNVTWKFMWSISTFYSIQAGKQHCFKDGILLHSKNGEIFEICTQHDNIPHIEVIYTDEIEYKALVSISRYTDHVAAIDRLDRLCIFELLTGKLTARLSLKHHGEVLHIDSHPTLPMFASCSVAGNCILIDITRVSLPKIFNCFHLYRNFLDKIKFSRYGKFLGIANSQTGMIFIVGKRFKQQRVDVLRFIEIEGYVADFLMYEGSDDRFEILVLATTNPSIASIGGNKVIVYTCEISTEFCTRVVCVIDLSRPFRALCRGCRPLDILSVPSLSVPDCLIEKNPSKYTDEDIAAIASYESKVQALQKEREKYKAILQADIIETKDALQKDIVVFNDKLKDLELKKIQIECAILQERLSRIRVIQRHRTIVNGRQKIAQLTDEELVSATQEARRFAEECNSLEMVVSELKVRYDSLCKAEKRQEAKFRGEFAELKQPIVEHLLRHYKKRPRSDRLTTTSITYLTEVARCVASNEKSDILPRECLNFLKGMDALDLMPRNLPPQISADYWRTMCKLRRVKIEVEIKVRCCAVEIAEAEQTLSFYQKTMQSADNVVACKKVSLDTMEKSLMQFAQEMEVQLVLKMGQIEVPLQGCSSDYANAILVTREELLRVNDCIVETGKRKLKAMYKSMHLRKIVSQHEWQHTCAKMKLEDLQRELKDIGEFKITRNVLEFLSDHPCSVNLEKDYEKMQTNLRIFRNRFRKLLELEKARLKETKLLMAKWKKKNDKISQEIKTKSSDVEKQRRLLDDSHRKRDEESRRVRLAAIARRTRLVMKAENNYEQLLILHAQLEVLKLRTYPTLQFKTA